MSSSSTVTAVTNGNRRGRVAVKPGTGFERIAWMFMRYSGLVLVFLALSHWGIQHLINSVHDLTLQSTVNRWGAAGDVITFSIWFWRAYYGLLLGLAMLHGLNGLRQVAYDYMHIRPLFWGFMGLSTLLILFVSVAGIAALFLGVNAAVATAAVVR